MTEAPKKITTVGVRMEPVLKAALERIAEADGRRGATLAYRIIWNWIAAHHPALLPAPMRRGAPGSYGVATESALSADEFKLVELWRKIDEFQRRLILDQLKRGALEVRDDPEPLLNDPGKPY